MQNYNYYATQRPVRKYGLFKFAVDVALTFLTGGFWLVWIFVREMRNR